MTKISAFLVICMLVQAQAQSAPGTGHTAETHLDLDALQTPQDSSQDGALSYWEKEFHQSAQKFYHHFEVFFVEFVVPVYHMVKDSALLTTVVLLVAMLYFTKILSGFFRGDGTKKFRYNKEEPISYSDLNQHFKNFTKELDALKQQVKNGPQGQPADSQAAGTTGSTTVNVPELDKLSKSLGKTEDHLTKLYQENKQLNQFLASFQREILESHKEIWKELHSLKTTRPATASGRTGERRGQSVSAEDRIPRRLQDTNLKSPQVDSTHRPKEISSATTSKPVESGPIKAPISNGTGPEIKQNPVSNEPPVNKSQELSSKLGQQQENHPTTEIKATESSNPFASPEKTEQKPPMQQTTNPVVRQPGFQKPVPQTRTPFGGGAIRQPPMGGAGTINPTTTEPQKTTTSQPEQKEEQAPVELNLAASNDKPTTTSEPSTTNETTQSNPEEEKSSTTTEQTNPEQESNLMPGPGPFKGLPQKKPTPVVRNNFAIPQKRVNPVPNNAIKKTPPMLNPGTNFVPNPDGGNGPNI